MIWPIDPIIEHDVDASIIWLENRGSKPQLFQVRAFKWDQDTGTDRYSDQTDVVVTPPMVQIAPGQRQLIRINRVTPQAPGVEQAYRVMVDEIPVEPAASASDPAPAAARAGVRFQYRYSLPLFTYGDGLTGTSPTSKPRRPATVGAPKLSWYPVTVDGQPHIRVRNSGNVHARISNIRQLQNGAEVELATGLSGYILAGKTMDLRATQMPAKDVALTLKVNGQTEPVSVAASPAPLDVP